MSTQTVANVAEYACIHGLTFEHALSIWRGDFPELALRLRRYAE